MYRNLLIFILSQTKIQESYKVQIMDKVDGIGGGQ
jgi:hypothetical protein